MLVGGIHLCAKVRFNIPRSCFENVYVRSFGDIKRCEFDIGGLQAVQSAF
jgi:hypothetical protein